MADRKVSFEPRTGLGWRDASASQTSVIKSTNPRLIMAEPPMPHPERAKLLFRARQRKMSLPIKGMVDRKVSFEPQTGRGRRTHRRQTAPRAAPHAALISDRRVTASRLLRLRCNAGVTAQQLGRYVLRFKRRGSFGGPVVGPPHGRPSPGRVATLLKGPPQSASAWELLLCLGFVG